MSVSGAFSSRSMCSGPATIVADDVYMDALTEGASVAILNRSRVLFTITSSYVLTLAVVGNGHAAWAMNSKHKVTYFR